MVREISLAEIQQFVGNEAISDWIVVDQAMIDTFAEATGDRQWIHTNPQRAKAETPFGGTIAHGFLTLSLLSTMNYSCLPKIREQTLGINYGFENVRFLAPVRVDRRVRGHFTLTQARFRGGNMVVMNYDVSIEIENERKPALTATWTTISQFDPNDRPADT
jgi:acyl dehydratase